MVTHSSVLAWRIPGTEEPGGLPSMVSHRVGHDCSDLAAAAAAIYNFKAQSTHVTLNKSKAVMIPFCIKTDIFRVNVVDISHILRH